MQKILDRLKQGLPKHAVSKRKQGNFEVSYIEGWFAISQANEIFGPLSWDMEVLSLEFFEPNPKHEVVARVRITVRAGDQKIIKEDVGFGSASAKQGRELASKEAVTDAMKRSLRSFGASFGNSLYDKANPLHQGGDDSHMKETDSKSKKILEDFKVQLEGVTDMAGFSKLMKSSASNIRKCSEEEKNEARKLANQKKKEIVDE